MYWKSSVVVLGKAGFVKCVIVTTTAVNYVKG